MANILGLLTNNGKQYLEVDADPSAGGGTSAPIGSIATLSTGGVGTEWVKVGTLDTDWDKVVTLNSGSNVSSGAYRRIALFDTNPSAPHVGDTVVENGQNVHAYIVAQPTRAVGIDYIIPNPGDNVSSAQFVLTEGAQTINGNKTFSNDVTVGGNLTVNGTLTYLNSTVTEITDPNITLNKGGAVASGAGAGIAIEENALITGYVQVSADRNGWDFLAPNVAFAMTLDLSNLTANRNLRAPDTNGTLVARANGSPGVAGQIAFYEDADKILSSSNFFWDNSNGRLGIGTNAPSTQLHVVGNARITGLSAQPGVVHNDANGNLVSGAVVLTSEVSGVLPVANGGTNSGAALNNNRMMVSVGGAIVEHSAMTTGSLFFAGATGLPQQDNANLFWDDTNNRLGLGTNTPARLLDVNGSTIFRGPVKYNSAGATNASLEFFQAQASTTNATTTTIATIAIPTDTEVLIEARIQGRRTGGTAGTAGDSAAYIRTAHFKNVGGTVTRISRQTDFTSEDQNIWDGDIIASGTDALIQVKGATNNNVSWITNYEVSILA